MRRFNSLVAAALTLGSSTYAQLASTCNNNICFALNIPETTASSGSGDVYFQITAPTTFSWVALGQGSQMSGSQMFVLYTDASGTNVTLSPRLGTGHVEPNFNSAAQITMLDGTGVANGKMTANFRCSSCSSWTGGSMDFKSSSGKFIYASKSGSALNSDSASADISQHNAQSSFQLDFTQARGGDSINPFASGSTVAASSGASGSAAAASCTATGSVTETSTLAAPTGSGCPTAWPTAWSSAWPSSRPTELASCFGSRGYNGRGRDSWPTSAPYVKVKRATDDSCNTGASRSGSSFGNSGSSSSNGAFGLSNSGVPFGGDFEKGNRVLIAHGVIASLAFVILFPLGGISIRLLSFPGLIWFHAAIQALSYLLYIAAAGLGIYLAQNYHMLNNRHPIIGLLLLALLFFQPFLGYLHHRFFKSHNRRTFWSHAHIWLGRFVITLGIINGGLGLQLAGNAPKGQIAYAVIAAIVWVIYVASIVVGEMKRRKATPPSYGKSMQMSRNGSSESGDVGPNAHGEWYGKRH